MSRGENAALAEAFRAAYANGVPNRSHWTTEQWLDFLDGWQIGTLGSSAEPRPDSKIRRLGSFCGSFVAAGGAP